MHRSSGRTGGFRPRTSVTPWWRSATIYRIYLPSFCDGNADGSGDLVGLRERLGYLGLLGIDAMSVGGAMSRPAGSDGLVIDPTAGGLLELDALVGAAHDHALKVILELPGRACDDGLERTLRFWLDRGVDGFRIVGGADIDRTGRLLRIYPGKVLVAADPGAGPRLRLVDQLGRTGWEAAALTAAIAGPLSSADGPPAWALSGRGVSRPASRYGSGPAGVRRARAAALLHLGLPGAVEICAGDELGLPDVPVDPESGLDPDATRLVPLPWAGEKPAYDFTAHETSWLPVPEGWVDLTVESQLEDAGSTLSLYRRALELRSSHPAVTGDSVEWYGAPAGCLAFRRPGGLICAVNTTAAPVPLPPGEVVLSSAAQEERLLPGDSTVWLAQPQDGAANAASPGGVARLTARPPRGAGQAAASSR